MVLFYKKPTSCLKWLQKFFFFYHVLVIKWFELFGKIGVTLNKYQYFKFPD